MSLLRPGVTKQHKPNQTYLRNKYVCLCCSCVQWCIIPSLDDAVGSTVCWNANVQTSAWLIRNSHHRWRIPWTHSLYSCPHCILYSFSYAFISILFYVYTRWTKHTFVVFYCLTLCQHALSEMLPVLCSYYGD